MNTLAANRRETMNPPTRRDALYWLAFVGRLLVAVLFLLAAIMKIASPEEFAKDIRNYNAIPAEWSNLVALTFPWLELTTALLLVSGIWRREARIWMMLMTVGFTGLKFSLLARGLTLECGCFGHGNVVSDTLKTLFSGWGGIWLNFGMLAALGFDGWLAYRRGGNTKQAVAVTVLPTSGAAAAP